MQKLTSLITLLAMLLLLTACATNTRLTSLNDSEEYYDYIQPSFSEYLLETKVWLKENRAYLSAEQPQELAMNLPFELKPSKPTDKAILLVHGLSDSPYSFSDLAKTLQQQGFYVQVLLLPGHGSKPEDLMLPRYEDWQTMVDHYANLLKQDYDQVWLGGFSTGGNLVTIHSIENTGVSGLLLFSPGFQSRAPFMERLAPFISLFIDGYTE